MLTFAKGRAIAEVWVSAMSDGEAELVREFTIAKPYGWIFFYQSTAFIRDPSNTSARLAGNGPLLVNRNSGEVRGFGAALPPDVLLTEYERLMPPAQMYARPEEPKWDPA